MKRKILVVDDNTINRSMLCKILSTDYDTMEAVNGSEALEIIKKNFETLSAVMLDIVMPVMDGFEVLKYVRDDPVLTHIPIIVTTGNTEQGAEVKALALGANDYIVKPYNPAVILHRLWNTINLRETAAIANLAKFDPLTGLYNRLSFFEKANELIEAHEAGYYVMASFDISNFKVINDQYGTKKGDEVLKHVADTFSEGFSEVGGICCRISGDHYAVLYPVSYMDTPKQKQIAHKAASYDANREPLNFSIGRYIVDDKTVPVNSMYDRATMAEESVKGRFDVQIGVYDEKLRERMLTEQELVSEMGGALSAGQFELWFQPQYNHSTRAIVGAEALIRWRHPKKGMIPPGEFVPLFEKNGFIYELDKFVWEEACRYLRKWLDEGRSPVPVSVNISRYDIFREELINVLTGFVESYNIPVELLRLEVTESAFAESSEQIISVVKALSYYGFTVEIDDFGSGYSSLNTLKDVPATVVKLDMDFLRGTENSTRGGNIVESVVRMTKWLGMSVIAEGVETVEQADYLESIGCVYMQGYYYARPMCATDYETLAPKCDKEENFMKLETVDHLNNEDFWNPDSMDTLVFNSYVGGASVYEFFNGKIEILRVNKKYAEIMGDENTSISDALKISWADYLKPEDLGRTEKFIARATQTNEEVVDECTLYGLKGKDSVTHLRSTIRLIAKTGQRYLFYCMLEDVTAQREAEKKFRLVSKQMSTIMDNISDGVTAVEIGENDSIKFIFANEGYYTMLGYSREQYLKEVKNSLDLVHPDDLASTMAQINKLVKNGGTASYDYRAFKRNKDVVYLRCNASITIFEGVPVPVLLSVMTDVTAEREAMEAIRRSDEQISFLNSASHDLLSVVDTKECVKNVLEKTLEYFGARRAYIFEYDYKENVCRNTYSISAKGEKPYPEIYNCFPLEYTNWWQETYKKSNVLFIPDVDAIGEDRAKEKSLYDAYNIKSIFATALRINEKLVGTMGVEDPSKHIYAYDNLSALGDYVSVMIARRNLNRTLIAEKENAETLMDDTPGGFAKMHVKIGESTGLVYVNEGYCELRGMTKEEIFRLERNDATNGVHPDDLPFVAEAVRAVIADLSTMSLSYRVKNGDGGYTLLTAFGRAIKESNGDYTVNMYYTDPSEQNKEVFAFRKLLPVALAAMMNASEELSFVKDKDFKYICCSRVFANMVGLEDENEIVGKTDYDIFEKEIADKYRADDLKLLEKGQALVNYVEQLPSEDGIPRYSSTSKYILYDSLGGIIGLYGTGRDITETRVAFDRLKLITDSIPGGIASYLYTPEGIKLTYFNDGLCKLFGYTREEYRQHCEGRGGIDMVFKEDVALLEGQLEDLVESNIPIDCTYRVKTAGGETRWINLKGLAYERRGDNMLINTVQYDVTNLKRAAESVKVSKEQTNLVIQLVNDSSTGVYVCDTESYELLYVNDKLAEMCGKTVEEAKGMTCHKYMKDFDWPCKDCLMDCAKKNVFTEKEYTSYASGKHYLTRGKIIDWGGRRALVEYMTDETDRVNTQRNLHDLLNGLPCGAGIFNYEGNGRLELVYMNDGYYDILGVERKHRLLYTGHSVINAMHPADRMPLSLELAAAAREYRTANCDIRIRCGTGYKWMNVKANVAYRTDDKSVLYVAYSVIDEEKKALLQLEAGNRTIRLATEEGRVSIFHYNMDKHTLEHEYQNGSLLGYPTLMKNIPEAFISSGYVTKETEEGLLEMFKNLENGAERSECTVCLLNCKTKLFEWHHVVFTRIYDSYYTDRMAVGICMNVELQQSVKLSYEHERRLREAIMKDAVLYYEIDLTEMRIEQCNFRGYRLPRMKKGTKFSDVLRGEILAGIIPEDREKVRNTLFADALKKAYENGERSVTLEYRRIMPEKNRCWVKMTANIMQKPDTGNLAAFLYATDIDENKKDELAVASIAAEETDSVALLDVKSGMAHYIKTPDEMKGIKPGMTFSHVRHLEEYASSDVLEEDVTAYHEFLMPGNLKNALKDEKTAMISYRRRDGDGNILYKRTTAYYLDDTHESIVLSRRDVTDIHMEEEKHKSALQNAMDEAVQANKAKGEFLSRVSHDMRTPMNAIMGMVSIAREEDNPVQTTQCLDTIDSSGHLMLAFIDDMLEAGDIENGRITLKEEPYTLEEFTNDIKTVVTPLMNVKNIDFVFDMACGAKSLVADKSRFVQIFFNLLSNAAKYTPEGGRVEFSADHIPDKNGKHGMRFYIRDNGVGMSKEFLKNLFDPLSQEAYAPSEMHGTGMGLAIVKKLVDAMGGSVSVKSEQGVGTEFTVDLYAKMVDSTDVKRDAKEKYLSLNGVKVLAAEDNAINALIVEKFLQQKECVVVTAKNGKEAVEMFSSSEEGYYNVILMDVRMPVMDGIEATKAIRELKRADNDIPIVAVTADVMLPAEQRLYKKLMNDYIRKPIEKEVLFDTIENVLKKRPKK